MKAFLEFIAIETIIFIACALEIALVLWIASKSGCEVNDIQLMALIGVVYIGNHIFMAKGR